MNFLPCCKTISVRLLKIQNISSRYRCVQLSFIFVSMTNHTTSETKEDKVLYYLNVLSVCSTVAAVGDTVAIITVLQYSPTKESFSTCVNFDPIQCKYRRSGRSGFSLSSRGSGMGAEPKLC